MEILSSVHTWFFDSIYLETIVKNTTITETEENLIHYHLWAEDYLIDVISQEEPIIKLLMKNPNLNIERNSTYVTTCT